MSAERSLLGCILLDSHETEIFTDISADDFVDAECRELFIALSHYWQKYRRVDVGCVPAEFRALAAECADFVPSLSGWRLYLEAAKRDAAKARAQGMALAIASGNMDLDEIRQAAGDLVKAAQGNETVRRMGMRQAIAAFWTEQNHAPEYLKTGIEKLDKTAYIERGDYVVIGARPSTGKTAFALKLARNLSRNGIKSVFYSYETTIEKMMGRTMAAHCGVGMGAIKRRELSGVENVEHLGEDLAEWPLEFVQSSGKGAGWIKADVIRSGAKAMIIDYIGLMAKFSPGSTRFEQVTNASMEIRDLCQSTGAVAFVLCQINRGGSTAPRMEDLKESGQIEQDADTVLILHNPSEIQQRGRFSTIELIVAKNKEGQVGKIALMFDGEKQDFWEVDDAR